MTEVKTELDLLKATPKDENGESDTNKWQRSVEGRVSGRRKKRNFLQLHPRIPQHLALEFVDMADDRGKTQGEFFEIVFSEWKQFRKATDQRDKSD